jgi:putative membrane protein
VTAVRIALTELRRLTAGRLAKLAVLAMVVAPLLYGALYGYANWDPYGRLGNVPAAIVNADAGARQSNGREIDAGKQVVDKLENSNTFGWKETSADDADSGVHNGRYAFAMVIPRDFSASLASPGKFQPQQAQIVMLTNDANNYLVGTIANQVIGKAKEAVASQTGAAAAAGLLIGFTTIYDKTLQAADGAGKLADGAGKLSDGAIAATDGAEQLAYGTQQLAGGVDQLLDSQLQLRAGTVALASATGQAADDANRLRDGNGQLSRGLDTLHGTGPQLPEQAKHFAESADKIADGAARVADGNQNAAGTADQFATHSQDVVDGLDKARDGIADQLRQLGLSERRMQQVLSPLDNEADPLNDANDKVQKANGQLRDLANAAHQVADGSRQLTGDAHQLAATAPTLSNSISQAVTSSQQLSHDTNQLANSIGQLNDDATRLKTSQDGVVDGTRTLAQATGQLATGSGHLADGTRQLATGSGQLFTGTQQLAGQLGKSAAQIPHPDDRTREATAQTIGDPVALDSYQQASAGNYGSGLAPFFLALAIWIGGYLLFLLVKPLSARALASRTGAWQVAIGGWLPAAALGVVQAVLLFCVAIFGLGIRAAHPLAVLGLMVITALSYIAFLHALNALFGAVGKFLGLLLLMLQLISAGGTLPWQTIPRVLYPLHVLLPMSYVVEALRHLLYGAGYAGVGLAFAVLGGYLVGGLLLSTVAACWRRAWTPARLKPELVG